MVAGVNSAGDWIDKPRESDTEGGEQFVDRRDPHQLDNGRIVRRSAQVAAFG
jgi:hypothetical protein